MTNGFSAVVMYVCVRGIDFAFFRFTDVFWNSPNSVVFFANNLFCSFDLELMTD
jgi:hypothetical protein